MSAWDTPASSPGDTSKYLPREKMALARGNSISDASEKTGCLLMGCSREEGLHLSSFHECKTVTAIWFGLKKKKKSAYLYVHVLLLFCCPAAMLHVLSRATPSLIRAARLCGDNVTRNLHVNYAFHAVAQCQIQGHTEYGSWPNVSRCWLIRHTYSSPSRSQWDVILQLRISALSTIHSPLCIMWKQS